MLKGLGNQITGYFLVVQAQDLEGVRMVGGKELEAGYPIYLQTGECCEEYWHVRSCQEAEPERVGYKPKMETCLTTLLFKSGIYFVSK